jgi:hypothetical protein
MPYTLLNRHRISFTRGTRRFIATLSFAAAVSAQIASAQSLSVVPVGSELRIRLDESGARLKGRLAWVRGDTIALLREPNGEETRIWISALQSYTLRGRRSRAAGAKRGALIGGGSGPAMLATAVSFDLYNQAKGNVPSSLYVAPIALAAPLIGTGIGALTRRATWQTRVSLIGSLSTQHNRLAISIPF